MLQRYLSGTFLTVQSSTLFTGTQKLLNDSSTALLIIAPILAALTLIYMGLRKMNADEHDAVMWKKRMISVGIALVIVVTASGLVALVTGYYT